MTPPLDADDSERILRSLEQTRGFDFTAYKPSSGCTWR